MSKLISSLVLAFLLCVASSRANKVVDIGEICKQTSNPSLCLGILKPSHGKDLVSLCQTTINAVHANVTNTITLLKSLVAKSGRDPAAKAHYKDCLERFDTDDGALGDIDDIQRALKSGDYLGVNVHTTALQGEVEDCISGDTGEPPFPDHSLLPKYGFEIKEVSNIILVISNLLRVA